MVVVWHCFQNTIQVQVGSWQAYMIATLRFTWTGVDLFFVLSGFLIGGILYDAKNSKNYYQTFYLRRIFRILPLYFIWLVLFAIGLWIVGPKSSRAFQLLFNNHVTGWSYPLFLQNFLMAQRQTFGSEWLSVTWSLAVEEQFYLLLPVLVRSLTYKGIIWLAIGSIFFAPAARIAFILSGNPYFGPYTLLPCRIDALGFGVLIALGCRSQSVWTWVLSHQRYLHIGFALSGAGVLLLGHYQKGIFGAGLTFIALFYALLLAVVLVNPRRIAAAFRNRILVGLGALAYGIYIFHQGLNRLFHLFFFGQTPRIDGWFSLAVTLLALGAVTALAALSWRILEAPLIRSAHTRYRY